MKRSEMVEWMIKSWLGNFPNDTCDTDTVDVVRENCSKLLSSMEYKGMLPPTICYNSIGEYGKIKDTDILDDNDISFRWEKENE